MRKGYVVQNRGIWEVILNKRFLDLTPVFTCSNQDEVLGYCMINRIKILKICQ